MDEVKPASEKLLGEKSVSFCLGMLFITFACCHIFLIKISIRGKCYLVITDY